MNSEYSSFQKMKIFEILKQSSLEDFKRMVDENLVDKMESSDSFSYAIHVATHLGLREKVEILLDAGVWIDLQDGRDRTPLSIAVGERDIEMMKMLIDRGADMGVENSDGYSPLMLAADVSFLEGVELLIERGCAVNKMNDRGVSALHVAAEIKKTKVLSTLIAHGADVCSCSKKSRSPLHVACMSENEEAARLLVKAGARFDVADGDGRTPLHASARYGSEWVLSLGLTESIIGMRDKKGKKAADLAMERGFHSMAAQLSSMETAFRENRDFNEMAKTGESKGRPRI